MKNGILILLALLAAFLIVMGEIKSCNSSKPVDAPVVRSADSTTALADQVDAAVQKVTDSFQQLQNRIADTSDFWKDQYYAKNGQYIKQESAFNDILNQLPANCDTARLRLEYNRLRLINAGKDASCKNAAAAQQRALATCDQKSIKQRQRGDSLRHLLDSALNVQARNSAYTKQLEDKAKPRGGIFVGAQVQGGPAEALTGFGPTLAYMTKKGLLIQVGALFGSNVPKQFTLGISTQLFKH